MTQERAGDDHGTLSRLVMPRESGHPVDTAPSSWPAKAGHPVNADVSVNRQAGVDWITRFRG
jgi:hypothetical protein